MIELNVNRLFVFSLLVALSSSALTVYEFYGVISPIEQYFFYLRNYIVPLSFATAFSCVAFISFKGFINRSNKNVLTLDSHKLFVLVVLVALVASDLTMLVLFGSIDSVRYYMEFLIGLLIPSALVIATVCVIFMKQKLAYLSKRN